MPTTRSSTLAAELREQQADLGRRMAGAPSLGNSEPSPTADGELLAETQASCEANVAQILQMLERGEAAEQLVLPRRPPRTWTAWSAAAFRCPCLLRAYRLGHQWMWDRWSEQLRLRVDDADALADVLESSSGFLFGYIDLIADALVEEYGSERDRLVRSAQPSAAKWSGRSLPGSRWTRKSRAGAWATSWAASTWLCASAGTPEAPLSFAAWSAPPRRQPVPWEPEHR